jgi:hypothetical protein
VIAAALAALVGCGDDAKPAAVRAAATPAPGPCSPPAVHHSAPAGLGGGLEQLPWIAGAPPEAGLVGVLAYWPPGWQHVREARIYAGGVAPGGVNMKTMWAFLGPSAKRLAGTELVVRARRMDGPGTWHDTFAAIGYEGQHGVPSYASIIALPKPGCWRLSLSTGSVRAYVDLLAVRARKSTAAR